MYFLLSTFFFFVLLSTKNLILAPRINRRFVSGDFQKIRAFCPERETDTQHPRSARHSVLRFTAHFSAACTYNHRQPVRLLLWKWTLGANKEVKHKHCEPEQRAVLCFRPTWVTVRPAFTCPDPGPHFGLGVCKPVGLALARSLNGLIILHKNMRDPLNTRAKGPPPTHLNPGLRHTHIYPKADKHGGLRVGIYAFNATGPTACARLRRALKRAQL